MALRRCANSPVYVAIRVGKRVDLSACPILQSGLSVGHFPLDSFRPQSTQVGMCDGMRAQADSKSHDLLHITPAH
jgi:hypothetical protein